MLFDERNSEFTLQLENNKRIVSEDINKGLKQNVYEDDLRIASVHDMHFVCFNKSNE